MQNFQGIAQSYREIYKYGTRNDILPNVRNMNLQRNGLMI